MKDLPEATKAKTRIGQARDATRADSNTQWRAAGRRLSNQDTPHAVEDTRATTAATIRQKSRTR
jgi:hypothetical protein